MEVSEITPEEKVDIVLWGPYPTIIKEIIGDIVGVVRNSEYAIGIQSLNTKTLGGPHENESDVANVNITHDDLGKYENLPPELNKNSIVRGKTAWPTSFGSILQFYCRKRDKDRIINNWGHEKYLAPEIEGSRIVGTKIAFFGCPASEALDTIGEIEIGENLPHPTINGIWAKKSPLANRSYLIIDFSEKNIEQAIRLTKQAGLDGLYHSSPFDTWGHFKLKKYLFPNGRKGFRDCVEKARKEGITIGFHSLSNFTTPTDSYVSPLPDPRLAKVGFSTLTADIDTDIEEIPIESPEFFQKDTELNTVVIGNELIHYWAVSKEPPWKLLDCSRAEWGSNESVHKKGEKVGKLMDHGYKVFLTDFELTIEEAKNLAEFCNETGALQMSMDGLEGNWSTGHGQYGVVTFAQTWYNTLSPEIKANIRNDASIPEHFNWHINTYFNWGEPWYAGFRESQTLYRFKNQVFYERNFIPKMLGWFSLSESTSIEDTEWLLARAAGYNSGFTLALSVKSTAQQFAADSSIDESNNSGIISNILDAIREWETARMTGAFTKELQRDLCDNSREFHLEPISKNEWDLYERHLNRHKIDSKSSLTEFKIDNQGPEQPLQLILSLSGKIPINDFKIMLNGKQMVEFKGTFETGCTLKYSGGPHANIFDKAWINVGQIFVEEQNTNTNRGSNTVSIEYEHQDNSDLQIEVYTLSKPKRIVSSR
jgi:hypothetical protein